MNPKYEDEFKNLKLKETAVLGRQILLYFLDFNKVCYSLFATRRMDRIPLAAYDNFRQKDKINFSKEIYRLKRAGTIKRYFDDKGDFLEITPKGKEIVKKYLVDQIEISLPAKWDKKWRLVIFDIPDDKRNARDILRDKLEAIGFYQLQESVYVFPFECLIEIDVLRKIYLVKPYVQYIIADRIETEVNLLKIFYDREILTQENI